MIVAERVGGLGLIACHGYDVFYVTFSNGGESNRRTPIVAHSCARKIAFSSGYTSGLRPRGKFRSSLFKGLPEPPRSAVAARTRRNLLFGVSFLLSANREASCS